MRAALPSGSEMEVRSSGSCGRITSTMSSNLRRMSVGQVENGKDN